MPHKTQNTLKWIGNVLRKCYFSRVIWVSIVHQKSMRKLLENLHIPSENCGQHYHLLS